MKKRAASLLLALCMILTLLPATAGAVNTETKQVVVMGTDVTAGGYWIVNSGNQLYPSTAENYDVAFSPSAGSVGTLTLKNVTLTVATEAKSYSYSNAPFYACIWTYGGLIINTIGQCYVDLSYNDEITGTCAAIAIGSGWSWLTFKGDGDLTVKGGPATKDSYGVYAPSSIDMQNAGTVEILGGPCGDSGISAGVYIIDALLAEKDWAAALDLQYVPSDTSKVIVGTRYGGIKSFGVYGRIAFSMTDTFQGSFTAYCGSGDTAMAIYDEPLYMPVGQTLLAGEDGYPYDSVTEAYRSERNGEYGYITTKALPAGAALQALTAVENYTYYNTIIVDAAAADASQDIEYAVAWPNNGYNAALPTTGWQLEPVFTGLPANHDFVIFARTAATLEHAAGPVKTITAKTRPGSSASSVIVNGVDAGRDAETSQFPVDGGGSATYTASTKTLTFSGKVEITHADLEPSGVTAGILARSDLNIVLEEGADVTIDLSIYNRDKTVVQSLENEWVKHKYAGYPLPTALYGITCQGELNISAAAGCTVMPKLTIRLQGVNSTVGILSRGTRDASSALTEEGNLIIDGIDLDVQVRGTGPAAVVTALQSLYHDITLAGGNINVATEGAYCGILMSAGAQGYGEVLLQGATVTALNNGKNIWRDDLQRSHTSARVSYNTIVFADGYTAKDLNDNFLDDYEAQRALSAIFLPNSKQTLTGTLVIEGAARVGSTLTAVLQDSNASGSFTYTWYYRHKDDSSRHGTLTGKGNQLTLRDNELNDYIYCTVTARGFNGSVTSAEVGPVTEGVFPELYVNNVRVNSNNFADVLSDGTVSYDVDAMFLTLSDATLTLSGSHDAVIYQNDERDLTVNLVGHNTITAPSSKEVLRTQGDLHITGDGTLNATTTSSSDYLILAQKGEGDSAVLKDLLIDGNCTVNISSPHFGISAGNVTFAENSSFFFSISASNTYGRGIQSTGTLLVQDNAVVSSTAGSYEAIDAMTVEISGGSVSAKNSGTSGGTGSYPAFTAGDITVNGGLLEASSESKYAIQATSLTLNRGRVEASSISYTAIQLRSAFNLNGGTLIAKNNSGAPFKGLKSVLKNNAPASVYYKSANSDGSDKEVITSTWDFGKTEYHYIELTTEFPPEVTAVTSGSSVTVSVKTDGQQQYLFIARFDSTGHLLELQQRLRGEEAILKAEFTFPTVSPTDRFTVFLLDDGCAPIHGAVTASGS